MKTKTTSPVRLNPSASGYRGFTLVELLVTVAILALLSALMLPTINNVLAMSRSTQCLSNLRQISSALLSFSQDRDNEILRWVDDGPDFWYNVLAKNGYMPYANGKAVWRCPANKTGIMNPGETGSAGSNMTYAINAVWPSASYDHKSGPSYPTGSAYRNKLSQLESPSKTISVCDGKSWLIADSVGSVKATAAGNHSGGMNAAFWDGHVEHFATVLTNSDPLFSISAH